MGRALVSVVVIGTCSLICRARENPDAVTLMGRVSGPDGSAIEGAAVQIVGRRLRTTTDAIGVFRFAGVTPAEFPGEGPEGGTAVHSNRSRPSRSPAPTLNGTRILFGMESVENGGVHYTLSGRLMRRVPNTRWDLVPGPEGRPKAAGDADSLIVTAPGFAPARCEIQNFTGILNFRLEWQSAYAPDSHPAAATAQMQRITSTQGAIPR
jgi:hypothetical protein